MSRFNTISVTLYEKVLNGTDSFGKPLYKEEPTEVKGILIGEPTSDEVTSTMSLYGKKVAYTLAIPKGDIHNWENSRVDIKGSKYFTIGYPTEGIESNIPLEWNKKVKVEKYG